MEALCKDLRIPSQACHAIFLTLDGCEAQDKRFIPVAWSRIARVLDRFSVSAEAPEVQLFARHYAKAIRRMSVVEPGEEEDYDGEV